MKKTIYLFITERYNLIFVHPVVYDQDLQLHQPSILSAESTVQRLISSQEKHHQPQQT